MFVRSSSVLPEIEDMGITSPLRSIYAITPSRRKGRGGFTERSPKIETVRRSPNR
ncbi:MAG: hypothetical protein VB125_03640 [Burkholderia sp.]